MHDYIQHETIPLFRWLYYSTKKFHFFRWLCTARKNPTFSDDYVQHEIIPLFGWLRAQQDKIPVFPTTPYSTKNSTFPMTTRIARNNTTFPMTTYSTKKFHFSDDYTLQHEKIEKKNVKLSRISARQDRLLFSNSAWLATVRPSIVALTSLLVFS